MNLARRIIEAVKNARARIQEDAINRHLEETADEVITIHRDGLREALERIMDYHNEGRLPSPDALAQAEAALNGVKKR